MYVCVCVCFVHGRILYMLVFVCNLRVCAHAYRVLQHGLACGSLDVQEDFSFARLQSWEHTDRETVLGKRWGREELLAQYSPKGG